MANRTTRRDRRNATHGYAWTNPEKTAHLNDVFRSASDAIEGVWAALRGAFPQRYITGLDQLDDDVEPNWDLTTDALVRPDPEEYTPYHRPDPNAPWIDAWGHIAGADR